MLYCARTAATGKRKYPGTSWRHQDLRHARLAAKTYKRGAKHTIRGIGYFAL